ncbi:MAG: hypothetical protein ABWJ98_04295 [Hydrogenothermaceae bacterium]
MFAENQFNITDRNLLFVSLKVDHYGRNGGYKDFTNYIARAGFVSYLNDNLYTKAFITKTYIPPSFYEIEMSKNSQDLSCEKIKSLSFETEYKKDNHKLNFFYVYIEAKDVIVFLPYSQNYNRTLKGHYLSLDYEYKFDTNNKISFNLFKTFSNFDTTFSSQDGGFIKVFNSTDKFDIYNELIYRKGFTVMGMKINDSFNYNVGVTYRLKDNWFVKLKGENLLNSSPKAVFVIPIGQTSVISLPSYDRRVIFSIEKVF